MSRVFVRDAVPSSARLVPFLADDGTSLAPTYVMAMALRAALVECSEEQANVVAGLEPDPDDPRDNEDAARRFRSDLLGRLYMANKVVRRISEYVGRLAEPPVRPDPIEDRAEVAEVLGEGFHTAFRKVVGGPPARQVYSAIEDLAPSVWSEVLDFVLDGLAGAGYSITRDPASCNCDDPLIHNGR